VHINDLALRIIDVCELSPHSLVLLYTQLPQDIIDEINNPNLHFNPNIEDTFIWSETHKWLLHYQGWFLMAFEA
jgi:hypothetical protein